MSSLPLFSTGPLATEQKPPPELRPYQQRAIRLLRAEVVSGTNRIGLVSPCGSGKMVIFAYIIRTATVPVLFVCHLKELINQCADQLAYQGITNVGVNRGDDERYNPSASVQLGSIQTLARRDPLAVKPGIILIDEFHHSASASYQQLFELYPDAIFVGASASPTRLDGKPLGGTMFQKLLIVATYTELLKNPLWLVAPDIYGTNHLPDLSSVHTTMGDFQEEELSLVMDDKRLRGNAVEHWLRLAHRHPVFGPIINYDKRGRKKTELQRLPGQFIDGPRRKTIVFETNIHNSLLTAEAFEKSGVRVAHLDGKTPADQRKAMLADLNSGKLEMITNCNILLEGFDAPSVKCIVHRRPTQSLVLWMQSTARAGRPWNGGNVSADHPSVVPLILDHAGNYDRHYSPVEDRQWSLSHAPKRLSTSVAMKLCRSCFAYVPPAKIICPHCGTEFPKGQPKPVQQTDEELVMRNAEPEEMKRQYFSKMAALARSRGFKPGFASAKYLEYFGCWPPRAWSDGLKGVYEQDAEWQRLLNARVARKSILDSAQKREEENWVPRETEEPRVSAHTCHATGCKENVAPEMWSCIKHWFMVPKEIRDRIRNTYRAGQCDDMNPSDSYCIAAKDGVIAVALAEGQEPDVRLYDHFLRSTTSSDPSESAVSESAPSVRQDSTATGSVSAIDPFSEFTALPEMTPDFLPGEPDPWGLRYDEPVGTDFSDWLDSDGG